MPQLGVIFVQYDQTRYRHSFSVLLEVLKPLQDWQIFTLRVDNKHEDQELQSCDNFTMKVGGDNTLFEFSGWMKGWETLTEEKGECDCYLFVTDAFLVYEDHYQNLLDSELLNFLMREQAVSGLIDLPPIHFKNLKLMDWQMNFWVRSSFFLVPLAVLQRMQSLISIQEIDPFCDLKFQGNAFRADSPLSLNYREYLEQWLTQGWHSAFPLTEENWERFRNKIRSVLNEHALTGRWQEMAIPLYDLQFLKLFSQKEKKGLSQILPQCLAPYVELPTLQKEYCAPSLGSRAVNKLKKWMFS